MTGIPPKVRCTLALDPFMKRCAYKDCGVQPVEWDHVWTGMGCKQINEWWAIIPFCLEHHRGGKRTKEVQEFGQWVSLLRGYKEAIEKYPKTDWRQKKIYLDSKFLKEYVEK